MRFVDRPGSAAGLMDQSIPVPSDAARRVPAAEREALLRAIIETAPDALITIDERGLIQIVNPAAERLFQYPAKELLGKNVSILMPAPHRERHDGYIARYLRTSESGSSGSAARWSACARTGRRFPWSSRSARPGWGSTACSPASFAI
jgi:PAS domain S-box-containing protein